MISKWRAVNPSYSIFPLGDSAATLDIGSTNGIDEESNIRALVLHDWLQANRFPGILDIIMAYRSVSVFYDTAVVVPPEQTAFARIKELLVRAWQETDGVLPQPLPGRLIHLPVCYEAGFSPDLEWVMGQTGLSGEEVIRIHCAASYRVYMIGFLPGFSYMGRVDPRLELPRKKIPVTVKAGGVGIAGMQTGVYPLNSPGGWQIIGRTPVRLFDPAMDPPVRLQTGDHVQFHPIPAAEYDRIRASEIVSPFI